LPRRPRGAARCRLQHITARGNDRQSIFEDPYDRERFYGILAVGIDEHDVECHADVLMGNHFHLLLDGSIDQISALLWFVNHRYARAYNGRHERMNHLLGRRFHSSEVPDARAARAVAVYIALNPVRAGFCDQPGSWAFGSFAVHANGADPRPHLTTDYSRDLFARAGTTLGDATALALAEHRGGRPALAMLMPRNPTRAHVRHAQEVYSYTIDEIATHLRISMRTLRRRLAA
jgi:putative transposase